MLFRIPKPKTKEKNETTIIKTKIKKAADSPFTKPTMATNNARRQLNKIPDGFGHGQQLPRRSTTIRESKSVPTTPQSRRRSNKTKFKTTECKTQTKTSIRKARKWSITANELQTATTKIEVLMNNQKKYLAKLRDHSPPTVKTTKSRSADDSRTDGSNSILSNLDDFQPPNRTQSCPPPLTKPQKLQKLKKLQKKLQKRATLSDILPTDSFLLDHNHLFNIKRTTNNTILIETNLSLHPLSHYPDPMLSTSNKHSPRISMHQLPTLPAVPGRTRQNSRSCPDLEKLMQKDLIYQEPTSLAPSTTCWTIPKRSAPSDTTIEDVQRRRLSLVLRNELRPINQLFEKRQQRRVEKWMTLFTLYKSYTSTVQIKKKYVAATKIQQLWKHHQQRIIFKELTRPQVIKGIKKLRAFAKQWSLKRARHIVSSSIINFNVEGFKKVVLKLRFKIIRIQRCWRTYIACTAMRIRSMELKWALVERHHRLELMDDIRISKSNTSIARSQTLKSKTSPFDAIAKNRRNQTFSNRNKWENNLRETKTSNNGNASKTSMITNKHDGVLLAVSRLDDQLNEKLKNSILTGSQKKKSKIKKKNTQRKKARAKALETSDQFNSVVPRHWTQFNAPPPPVVLSVTVRQQHCTRLLQMSRNDFIQQTPVKVNESSKVFQSTTIKDMKRYLASSSEKTIEILKSAPPVDRSDVATHRILKYFTSPRNERMEMLKLIKAIARNDASAVHEFEDYTKPKFKKKKLKEIKHLFKRELLRPTKETVRLFGNR